VANAINYTTVGSITLSATRITQSTPVDSSVMVLFEVRDTGPGIAKSEQSQLWLPYVRGGTAPTLRV
jgi:signal transduction histidine kinase